MAKKKISKKDLNKINGGMFNGWPRVGEKTAKTAKAFDKNKQATGSKTDVDDPIFGESGAGIYKE